MINLFYRVIPNNETYNDVFYHDCNAFANYCSIYDWWEEYLNENVKCDIINKSLYDSIDYVDAYHLLVDIADYLGEDEIKYYKVEEKEEEESDEEEEDFESALEKARANKK